MKKGSQEKNQQKIVQDFCSMTGSTEEQAFNFLKRSNWHIQESINLFFDEQANEPPKQEIKESQQMKELFNSLSHMPENGKELEIEEEKFGEFVEKYFKMETINLAVSHLLVNVMKVERSGHISRAMFYQTFQHLGCSNPTELFKYKAKLENEIDRQTNPLNFKDMYMKSYGFYLIKKDTTLEYEIAVEMWSLYLKHLMEQDMYSLFISYCEGKKLHKVHKDLWKMVYEFALNVKNVKDVREDDGWPVFLDEFVEFCLQKNKMEIQ